MKKVIALLLTILFLLIFCTTAVSAYSEKITPEMQSFLNRCKPGDVITAYIYYNFTPKTVADMPGWPDLAAARAEYKAYRIAKQAEIQSVIFEGLQTEIVTDGVPNEVIAKVKAGDIEAIAGL